MTHAIVQKYLTGESSPAETIRDLELEVLRLEKRVDELEAAQHSVQRMGGTRPANCDCDSWIVLDRHDDWCPAANC